MKTKFKPGDNVKIKENHPYYRSYTYEVEKYLGDGYYSIWILPLKCVGCSEHVRYLELVDDVKQPYGVLLV